MEITKQVVNGYREPFTHGTTIPKKYQSLVDETVNQNPDLRPTFVKILRDLKGIVKDYENIIGDNLPLQISVKEISYIKWNELTDMSKVDSGHFGSVSKAYWSKTRNYVAYKKLI